MKYITVVFKNSIKVDGQLISFDKNEMLIKCLDGISDIVIPDVKENILFYKINSAPEVYNDIADKPNKTKEDLKKIAEAKGELNAIERASISEKIRNPLINYSKKEIYVSRNQSFPSSLKYPEKETPRTDTHFVSGLREMFNKKH